MQFAVQKKPQAYIVVQGEDTDSSHKTDVGAARRHIVRETVLPTGERVKVMTRDTLSRAIKSAMREFA